MTETPGITLKTDFITLIRIGNELFVMKKVLNKVFSFLYMIVSVNYLVLL